MREQCLLEFDFADPYMVQKRNENQLALGELKKRITELDLIADDVQRQTELVIGLLAGKAVALTSIELLPSKTPKIPCQSRTFQ